MKISNELIVRVFFSIILILFFGSLLIFYNGPVFHTYRGGVVSLTYQEGHENETVNFNRRVLEEWPNYILFDNLNDSYCYWVGLSYYRDASLHFTQIGYVNDSIVLVQWNRDLLSVWLMRGDPLDYLIFILILSIEW